MRAIYAAIFVASLPFAASAQSFGGYPCTQDCSGHEAGYEWADKNGIDSADDCGGNSNSFIEGCQAHVEENHPESERDNDNNDSESNDLDQQD